ncbi:MAG: ABC transporter ATP-binding protein [Chloroflexota bacterium]|nr:ABC transporter ATP-binding protein [Chloroflexota bacterium]
MKDRPVLEVRGVWKVYGTQVKVEALRGVDLSIDEGELISIIGPSGSGKSTLMHVMGCLERPTEGEVILNGVNVAELSSDELAEIRSREIGFVFQKFNLLPRETAQKNVELPLIFQGVGRNDRSDRSAEMLKKVGLGHRLRHTPSQMSGGEQQRVAIARALISNPTIIIADEPTGNLDTNSSKEIMSILENLNKEGKTLVVVTHDPEVANCADRSIKILDGRVLNNET